MNPYASLVTDLAQHLANEGVAEYRTDGKYPKGAHGIYIGTIPDKADTGVGLIVYDDDRDRDDDSPDIRVQVRVRGDRNPLPGGLCHRTADRTFSVLHDQSNYTLNTGTRILLSRRHLRAPEERDENGRITRADSYTFTTNPGG
ncbi:minor capsid protein [Corynebacterium sp.]|uniref:phage tail terminator protein n=1 Tax=Corynebacterium sp. TaxID=1720 RepID=UPI0028AB66EF|nr:minor capsid protein [Corynebacterium sp.]